MSFFESFHPLKISLENQKRWLALFFHLFSLSFKMHWSTQQFPFLWLHIAHWKEVYNWTLYSVQCKGRCKKVIWFLGLCFLNCGWVVVKYPKVFSENTHDVYVAYLTILSIENCQCHEKFQKIFNSTFRGPKLLGLEESTV